VIHEAGADYVLTLKPNQPSLLTAAEAAFAKARRPERFTSEEQGHGRRETRTAAVLPAAPALRAHLPHLVAFGQVTAVRQIGEQVEESVRYLALSRRLSARGLAAAVREHWGIENHLHGTLDVVFDEDRARTRKNDGPENWAILRRLARNILELCPEPIPLRKKMKRASWSKDFCFSLFTHMR
jgi:predicted transposase YbfD/YdcC